MPGSVPSFALEISSLTVGGARLASACFLHHGLAGGAVGVAHDDGAAYLVAAELLSAEVAVACDAGGWHVAFPSLSARHLVLQILEYICFCENYGAEIDCQIVYFYSHIV